MLDTAKNSQQSSLNQLLEHSPDGIFTINAELEICYVNPAFCKIIGYTADEIIGTPITKYLGDLHILDVCMAEVSENGYCNDQETIFKRKDGSIVHISKNVQAIHDESGHFQEILVTIRDLTTLHQLNKDLEENIQNLQETQQQLIESEKLASLGSLVAGIAHEINTPLGISLTSATNMHEELSSLEKKFNSNTLKKTELEQFFNLANQACKILNTNLHRASDLIRSFKQVAVDQTVGDARKINICEYLQEVLTSIGPSFKHSNISVSIDCDKEIDLLTQPGAIYQIVSNLVLNSITHAFEKKENGEITISVIDGNQNITILVSDNGKGIPEENLKHIFTPFYTTKRGSGGSGLGLSITYNLVTGTLKGKINAESEPGSGTTFSVTFPKTQ